MKLWFYALAMAFAVTTVVPDAGFAASKTKKYESQQKKTSKSKQTKPKPKSGNNFTGAVLRCNPPITYEDWNRCGYAP